MAAADGPTVADWLGAWGQIGGVIATLVAVIVALAIGAKDRRRAEADRVEEARGRAAMVLPLLIDARVHIHNYGDRPVWQPQILEYRIDNGPPLATWVPRQTGVLAQVIGPHDDLTVLGDFVFRHPELDAPMPNRDLGDAEITVTVEFVDAEGRSWRRAGEGPPTLVDEVVLAGRRLQLGPLGIDWNRSR